MKRIISMLALLVALICAAPLALADAQPDKLEIDIAALPSGGEVLPGIACGMSRGEVIAAGYALAKNPAIKSYNAEKDVNKLTYELDNPAGLTLNGISLNIAQFQFANDKLLSMAFVLEDVGDAKALREYTNQALGEADRTTSDGELSMQAWRIDEAEATVLLTVLPRDFFKQEGESEIDASLIVTFENVYYDMYPGWKEPTVMIAAIERVLAGGEFIMGLAPGASADDVRAAGIPIKDAPEFENTSEDGLLTEAVYSLDDSAIVVLDGKVINVQHLQFVNGGFVNLGAGLPDAKYADELRTKLIGLLGEPKTTELEEQAMSVDEWFIGEGEAQLRVGLISQWDEKGITGASIQVDYTEYMKQLREQAAAQSK